ncbi:MAG TPA: peroxiredoxin family protein [Verrucomicrobiae bacterium]|nr:peroxiredoxin family protein [Verrucomicrobiae bacterium]
MKIFHLRNLVLALFASLLVSSVLAATIPQMGDSTPDFTLNTVDGQTVHLSDLTAKSDIVLVVLRGWPGYQCPLCTAQAHDFIQAADKFKAAGVKVVMVYPGPADDLTKHASDFLQDKNWPKGFTLVLDPDYSFTDSYGLRWNKQNETAYPSTFVIGKNGKVTFVHVSHQHGDRVKAETVLAKVPNASQDSMIK